MSEMAKKLIEAVIFDMDGVIFDSENLYITCDVEIADKLHMEGIVEACYRTIGVTRERTREILTDIYQDEVLVDRFMTETASLFQQKCREGLLKTKQGVRELLSFLKKRGYKTAIASSTATDIVEAELSEEGIRQCFDQIVGGDQVKRSKPAPDIFLKAAELLETAPKHCAVIEDSFNGIRASRAAGMTAIMVPDLLQPDEEIRALADFVLPSLAEVQQVF